MLKTSATGNIVPKVIYDIRSTQHRMKSDQDSLLATAKSLSETYPDFTFDNLDSMMRSTIAKDLLATGTFNVLVRIQHDPTSCPVPYGIRFNKMSDILSAVNAIASEENVAAILGGHLPCGYDNTLGRMLPTLGEEGTY